MIRWIKAHQEYMDFTSAARTCRTSHFYAPILASAEGLALGITISKKVGNAVLRNKLKRRIKAWCRMNDGKLPQACRMNLIARRGSAQLAWDELATEMTALMEQAR
jgi:ribonuclease P protein component